MLKARIRSLSTAAGYQPCAQPALSSRRQTFILNRTRAEGTGSNAAGTTPVRRYSKSHLMSFKKAKLQEMLSAAQLSTEGKKPDLVESLLSNYSAADASAPQAKVPLAAQHTPAEERAVPPTQTAPREANILQNADESQSKTFWIKNGGSSVIAEQSEQSSELDLATGDHETAMSPSLHSTLLVSEAASPRNPAASLTSLQRLTLSAEHQRRAISSTTVQPTQQDSPEAARECELRTGMAVQWLGTSSGAPTQQRNVSSILLLQRSRVLMVDCGEGTVNQLATAGLDVVLVSGIFVTHMHGDHIFGLPGLLRAISRRVEQLSSSRAAETLRIFGPPGIQELLHSSVFGSGSGLAMPVSITELTTNPQGTKAAEEVMPNVTFATLAPDVAPPEELAELLMAWQQADLEAIKHIFRAPRTAEHPLSSLQWRLPIPGSALHGGKEPPIRVTAAPLLHRLPCWGYVFEEAPTLEDGSVMAAEGMASVAEEVPFRAGRKVVLLGDTCFSGGMLGPGRHADVLSHECTFSNEEDQKAIIAMHSTSGMAGNFARKLRTRQLVLTHFSSRYKTSSSSFTYARPDNDTQAYLAQQACYGFGVARNSQQVRIAQDFYRMDVLLRPLLTASQAAAKQAEADRERPQPVPRYVPVESRREGRDEQKGPSHGRRPGPSAGRGSSRPQGSGWQPAKQSRPEESWSGRGWNATKTSHSR